MKLIPILILSMLSSVSTFANCFENTRPETGLPERICVTKFELTNLAGVLSATVESSLGNFIQPIFQTSDGWPATGEVAWNLVNNPGAGCERAYRSDVVFQFAFDEDTGKMMPGSLNLKGEEVSRADSCHSKHAQSIEVLYKKIQ